MSLDIAANNPVPVVLSPELALTENFKLGGVLSRQDVYQQAENNVYSPGQKVQFYLPSQVSDLRDHSVQFKITGTAYGAPATVTRFVPGIAGIFNRLEILFGSTTVMDIVNVGLLKNIIRYGKSTNYQVQTGKLLEGTDPSTVDRNTEFANPNRVYAVNFNIGLLNRIIPLAKIKSQLIIRLTLAGAVDVLVTDNATGTAGNYEVRDAEFHYCALVMGAAWNSLYDSVVSKRNGFEICYRTYSNFQNTNALQAGTTNSQIVLPYRYSSLLSICYIMRNSADIIDPLSDTKLTQFNYNDINTSRLKVNSTYYPLDNTRSLQDLYTQYADTFGISYYADTYAAISFGTSTFIQATSLMRHPKENRAIKGSLNGLNTVSSGTSIVTEVRFNSAIAATQQIDFFSEQEECVKFLPNGAIQYYQ